MVQGFYKDKKLPGSRYVWFLLPVVLLFLVLSAAVAVFPDKFPSLFSGVERVQNTLSFLLFGEPPHFYHLDMEKNGQGFLLPAGGTLELSYKDEFVIKAVSSDVIFDRGIGIDVEGIGTANDYRVLLKGIELIDHIVLKEKDKPGMKPEPYRIKVMYRGEVIATLPIKVNVLPQDWLRYARSTENRRLQIEYLKRAIAMNNKDVGVLKMLAGVYVKSGQPAEAISPYRQALEIEPNDANAWLELSKCYLTLKEYPQVIEAGRQVLRVNPRDATAYMNIGLAYGELGQWEKAIANFRETLQLNPDNPLARFKLGEAYEKTARLAEAMEQYRAVLSKVPTALHAMVALAGAAFKAANYDEAIKWYTQVVKSQPRIASLWANLGLAYGAKQLWKEELESYKKSIAINPNDPIVHFNLAVAYEKGKREQDAYTEYQKVLSLKPDDLDAQQRLASMDMRAKRFEQAAGRYEKIVKISPPKAVNFANLGMVYGALKRYKQAADNYEKAIKSGAREPQLHYNLAHAYEQSGRTKEAIGAYEKYAALHPTVEVLNTLAEHYLKEKQLDNAVRSYKKITELDPRGAAAYYNIGHIYGLRGDRDREIEYYKISLRYDADDYEVYQDLGAAYESKQMYAEAFRAYEKAYQLNPEAKKAKTKIPQMKIRMLEQKLKQ